MATFLVDTFTEAAGNPLLDAHTGETGATWTKHTSSGSGTVNVASAIDRARVNLSGATVLYYASGSPAGANYDVEGTFFNLTSLGTIGVIGRVDTAANTYYWLIYDAPNTRWDLGKTVAGTMTSLGTFTQTLTASTPYSGILRMVGTSLKAVIDGVERISVTDSDISAAGKAGVRGNVATATATGTHLEGISAADIAGTTQTASADVPGAGAVAASGTRSALATAQVAGAGAVNGQGGVTRFGAGAVSGTGAISATARYTAIGAASVTGTGTISATAQTPGHRWDGSTDSRWPGDDDSRWAGDTESRWA